MDNKVEGFQT